MLEGREAKARGYVICPYLSEVIQWELSKWTLLLADSSTFNRLHKTPFEVLYKLCIYTFP